MNILLFCIEIDNRVERRMSFYKVWPDNLTKAFEELGHTVYSVNFSRPDCIDKMNKALESKIDFAIGFNETYLRVVQFKDNNGANILNKLNIPFVSWLWDALFYPQNPAVRIGGINHLLLACISEDDTAARTRVRLHSDDRTVVLGSPRDAFASRIANTGGGEKISRQKVSRDIHRFRLQLHAKKMGGSAEGNRRHTERHNRSCDFRSAVAPPHCHA